MTRFPALAFLVALSGVAALGEIKENRSPAAPITVYTQFEEPCSGVAFEQMKAELVSIMSPIGLEFEWRSLDAARGNDVAVELAVVSFKGSCNMDEPPRPASEPGALGWTYTSEGHILPFSDVQCDRIRRFIGPLVADTDLVRREFLLGRAMGRVLAHELYHVFANTRHHGSAGVAKPFYSAPDLVTDRFRFEQKETRALRHQAFPALVRSSRDRAPAAASTGQ